MLARYQMKRGATAAELPKGVRQDTSDFVAETYPDLDVRHPEGATP